MLWLACLVVVAFRRTIGILAYARLHEELEFVRLRSLSVIQKGKSFVVILAWFVMVILVLILGQEEKRKIAYPKLTP